MNRSEEDRDGENGIEEASLSRKPDALDEIIREVAVRHGICVGRDDPILMIYTINRQVMETTTGIQRAMLDQHLAGLKSLSKELQDEATGRLDQTMRSATYSIRLSVEQEVKRLFGQQRAESEVAARKMTEELRYAQHLAGASLLVSFLALATAAAVLWAAG